MATNLLAGVLEAQTRNSLLAGDELIGAAFALVEVMRTRKAIALPSDSVGDRILGAALILEPTLPLADRSYRFDGCSVLIVAGHISGEASVSARAKSVRALGAVHVEAALLGQWADPIEGCDAVRIISSDRHLRAVVG
ncbi:hypothetical protein OCAE111667_04035 [Occultella aeris]|uniref:Uncharacterized protein n=1 Tax=Occultella aeris TaxID=2761496 RepID=A0A7M4DGA7_9MICO|nr:hypothetical protein [Occultella aeris]VZO35950.1 hypothetical protein HALOF300_01153 [Occultella aeris]